MKRFHILLLLLTMASMVFPAMPPNCPAQTAAPPGEATGAPGLEQQQDVPRGNYVIGRGDVLEVNVWREPMLSGETTVRNDGMISLALVGDVQAAGRTTMDVKDEIETRLKQYLGEPVVTVMLRTAASQKFYVVGEVRTPGEYDLIKDMTVLQGIARAGGFTEWAKTNELIILRRDTGVEKKIPVKYRHIVKGKCTPLEVMLGRKPTRNILLQANDTIVVP